MVWQIGVGDRSWCVLVIPRISWRWRPGPRLRFENQKPKTGPGPSAPDYVKCIMSNPYASRQAGRVRDRVGSNRSPEPKLVQVCPFW